MLFNSFIFVFAFLPVTYGVFWALRSADARYRWLTVTGYFFYGWWDWRFCFLMLTSTVVSYWAGRLMLQWTDQPRRRLALTVPIVFDLMLLGFFKYANFGLESARTGFAWLGIDLSIPHYNIILPVGISFYTFHTITYIVDCYRGVVTPTRNFFEFSCYVSLFSQLVAGPIVRFRQIEEDLVNLGRADRWRWFQRGISFFAIGMVEKVLVADTLASFVDPMLAQYQTLSTAGAWVAVLGYTGQLYFDFSGYSTMAVGLGYLFGVRIPQNFNSPYKALDPSDFWRRWHISLSTCLRDYVYIPLGGNRAGPSRTARNMMYTMLIGGLWHGAAWTFVFWGAYHGALLIGYRAIQPAWDRWPAPLRQWLTFLAVVIGWVFFRSTSFGMAAQLLETMFLPTSGVMVVQPLLPAIALIVALGWAMAGPNAFDLKHEFRWRGRLAIAAALGAALAVVAGSRASPFLYFQF